MPTFVPFALDTPQVNRCRVCQGRWRLFFSFKIDESFYYGVVFIELFTLPKFYKENTVESTLINGVFKLLVLLHHSILITGRRIGYPCGNIP